MTYLTRDNHLMGCPGSVDVARSKIMIINSSRIAYAGLLGAPSIRQLGAIAVYASLGSSFRIELNGRAATSAQLAVVQPYTPHRISTNDRRIGVLLIEPESVDVGYLPGILQESASYQDGGAGYQRIRDSFSSLLRGTFGRDMRGIDIDRLFFECSFQSKQLESRIASVVDRIVKGPNEQFSAKDAAEAARLSVSRFLHLFTFEVGTAFRCFRAWKRARSFMDCVKAQNLTDVALDLGYPDSSHFSHSIRHVYGLRPRDIFVGSRALALVSQAER